MNQQQLLINASPTDILCQVQYCRYGDQYTEIITMGEAVTIIKQWGGYNVNRVTVSAAVNIIKAIYS